MQYPAALTFSSGYPLGFLPCVGLHLWVLRQFQAFLAFGPCVASATSYHFASVAPPPWRSAFSRFAPVVNLGFPVLASGSNCAVKPTRLRRAAYFRSLDFSKQRKSMEDWDASITEVVNSLSTPFDSHLVIKELAHKNQRRYVDALAAIKTETPFHQLHSSLGRRIKVVCDGLGLKGSDSRSPDMFGQQSKCQKWSR